MKVFVDTAKGDRTFLADLAVSVASPALLGACPPNSVKPTLYANSILFESAELSGCVTDNIPAWLITQGIGSEKGKAQVEIAFSWERVPSDASVEAVLFLNFAQANQSSELVIIDMLDPILLAPVEPGSYTYSLVVSKPENSVLTADLIINILENPKREPIVLELERIKISSEDK